MNPRIKAGFDYFWNLKPSTPITKEQLIILFHRWQLLLSEEFKKKPENITDPDINKFAEELFGGKL